MNLRQAILLIGLIGGGVAGNACYDDSVWDRGDSCVDPKNPFYVDDLCVEFRHPDACNNKSREAYDWEICEKYRKDPLPYLNGFMGRLLDAGTDAADAADAADATSEMGDVRVRMGRCGPDAPLGWTDPQPVWFGPISEAPVDCVGKIGSFGARAYSELIKPALDGCAECNCEPIKGTCSLAADTIHFRNAMCGGDANVMSDFGPLENWDGSCMSDHALTINGDCPVASGIPCVQSMYVSGLLEPSQGCKTIETQVANAITDVPKWNNTALSCSSTPVSPSTALWNLFPKSKQDIYNTCVPGGEGWRTCIQPDNIETIKAAKCEANSLFTDKIVTYAEDGYIDTRSCSACDCESGGACVGTLNIYEDSECKNVLATELLDSNGPACDDLLPPGKAIGSKDLTDLHYVPGNCKATGGIPQGDVVEDETKLVIWCCLTEESALYNIDLE